MARRRVSGKGAAEDGNVETGAQMLSPLRKRGDGLIGCVVQLPDLDRLAGLEGGPRGRQGLAGGLALGLVADGEDEPGEAEVEELPRAFEADAAVGPRHDGCPAAEVSIAAREGQHASGELPAEELELAGFPLGCDVK